MNSLTKLITGVQFDNPQQMRDWMDGQNLTPKQRHRVQTLADHWQTYIDQTIVRGVDASVEQIGISATEQQSRVDGVRRRIAEVQHAAKTGRVDKNDALTELGTLRRELNDAVDVLEALDKSGERARSVADQDTAEWLEERRQRFPAAADAYRLDLTVAYLDGEQESPLMRR